MKRLVTALGLLGATLLLAACSSSGAPASASASASVAADAVQISAKDLKFSTDRLEGPAGKAFQIAFDNQDSAPHNVAIYKTEAASEKIMSEPPVSGPKTVVYNVPAQPAGSYFFRCDVHPDMKGTLEIK